MCPNRLLSIEDFQDAQILIELKFGIRKINHETQNSYLHYKEIP
jgi:hypothetical protein